MPRAARRSIITACAAAALLCVGCAEQAQSRWAQSTPVLEPTEIYSDESAADIEAMIGKATDGPPIMAVVEDGQFPR